MASSHDIVSHPFTITLIQIKARQLCRRSDFSRSDYEDLIQDMRLYLVEKAHLFDPARGNLEAFVTNALNTWVAMHLRHLGRQKRRPVSRAISLEGTCLEHDGNATTLGAVLSDTDHGRRTQRGDLSPIERHDLRDAVDHAMITVAPDERALLIQVVKLGVAGAARARGVSRRQIKKILARLRARFEDAGLGAN